MKIMLFLFITCSLNTALAHCPLTLAEEKACILLEQNIIYIYDTKFEHNGPYKNFKFYQLKSVTSGGKKITFQNASRGVIKLDSKELLKSVELELEKDAKIIRQTLKSE